MIDEVKKLGEWKIHLTMKVNFIKKLIHSESGNTEIMIVNKT